MKKPETKAKGNVAKASQMPVKTKTPPILSLKKDISSTKRWLLQELL
jgi:hypothetical protein